MPIPISLALALLVALGGPRARGLLLTGLALLALFALGGLSLLSTTMPLALFALCAFLGATFAFVLPRLLPRIFIALLAGVALPFGPLAAHGKPGIALAVLGFLAVFFYSVRKPEWVLRLACAGLGSAFFISHLPERHALWARAGIIALLFALEALVRWKWPPRAREPWRVQTLARSGAALGAVLALSLCALPLFARPLGLTSRNENHFSPRDLVVSTRLDLPPLPFVMRRDTLSASAPHGGLIWPLPSEALTWDEPNLNRALFPRIDNLDALYLGVRTHGLVALPPAIGPLFPQALLGSVSLHAPIAAARLKPDLAALARMRAAALATASSLEDILPMVHPGMPEARLEATLKAAMRQRGCGPESFPLIFASGPSAAAPHGSGNLGVLQAGTLVVADIGCSIDHYASDFTRTLPVSKTFTPRQRLLYENVLAAQDAALAQCKPGAWLLPSRGADSMEKTARDVLIARAPDHLAHMDHSLGHTVGLFVHDIWLGGPLEEGNVITIEPGTYLPNELGIRIEDTFLVTKDGCERLTGGFPASPDAIEARLQALGK